MADSHVSIIGPLPPPVQGAALVTDHVCDALEHVVKVERLPISPAAGARGIAYHISRVVRVFKASCAVASGRGPVYLSAAGGLGLFYNVILALIARVFGRPLFVHHHSFAYLDHWNWLASLLVWVCGSNATHICLCPRMAQSLMKRYGTKNISLLSNAAFYPPQNQSASESNAIFRLGHLSNLSEEKGLDYVVAVASALIERGVKIELRLAGPVVDAKAEAILADGRRYLGRQLIEMGPLYGAGKDDFWSSIDLFLFPSRYANEAEPLVVLEALAHGLPVLASGRGCITEQVGDAGVVIGPENDFVKHAVAAVVAWSESPIALAAIKAKAKERSAILYSEGKRQLEDTVMHIRANVA